MTGLGKTTKYYARMRAVELGRMGLSWAAPSDNGGTAISYTATKVNLTKVNLSKVSLSKVSLTKPTDT